MINTTLVLTSSPNYSKNRDLRSVFICTNEVRLIVYSQCSASLPRACNSYHHDFSVLFLPYED